MKRLYYFLTLVVLINMISSCNNDDETSNPVITSDTLYIQDTLRSLPILEITDIQKVDPATLTINVNVLTDGGFLIEDKGISYSTDSTFEISNNFISGGNGNDDFIIYLQNLIPGQEYFFRTYAVAKRDTVFSSVSTFTLASNPGITADINGQDWVSSETVRHNSLSFSNLPEFLIINWDGEQKALLIVKGVLNSADTFSIAIRMSSPELNVGTYSFGSGVDSAAVEKDQSLFYPFTLSATVTITQKDTIDENVSGTFEFDAVNNLDTAIVRNGEFKFINYREW